MQPHIKTCLDKWIKPENFAKLKESNDAEGLISACRSYREYERCVLDEGEKLCPLEGNLNMSAINEASGNLFWEHKWVCQGNKNGSSPVGPDTAACSKETLSRDTQECFGILKYQLIPFVRLKTHRRFACQGLEAYKTCLDSVFEDCTNASFVKLYDNTSEISWYVKQYETVCTQEHEATCNLTSGSFDICLGIVTAIIKPNAYPNAVSTEMSEACKGVGYYGKCVQDVIKDKCGEKEVLPSSRSLLHFTIDIPAKYNWTCKFSQAPDTCDTKRLSEHFSQCKGFLRYLGNHLEKKNGTNDRATTCRYLHYYTTCINQEFTETCGKTPKTLSMPEMIEVGEKYKFYEEVCKVDAPEVKTCTKTAVEGMLNECKGIMTTIVVPASADKSDVRSLKVACKYLRYYQECVSSQSALMCSEEGPSVTDAIKQSAAEYYSTYNWTCDATKDLPSCSKETFQEKAKTCFEAYITKIVIPHARASLVSNYTSLEIACTAVHEYQDCVLTKLVATCPEEYKRNDRLLEIFTDGVYGMYNWTCALRSPQCTEQELQQQFQQCHKIVDAYVVPNIQNVSDSGQLRTACTYTRKYQDCLAHTLSNLCKDNDTLSVTSLNELTQNKFGMYNWTCEIKAVSCMEDFISAQISNCTAVLSTFVLPYAKKGATWSQLKTACKGHQDYQSCVLQQGFRYCEDGMNDAKLLQSVTNGSFAAYSWTCETQGKVCREEYLENCSTIITTVVSPNIKEPLELFKLRQACRGVHAYQTCVNEMNTACPIEGIYSQSNMSEITQEVFNSYNWTCNYEGCTNQTLKFALSKCDSLLETGVKPYALNGSADVKLDKACKGLHKYEDCVIEVHNGFCPNKSLSELKLLNDAARVVEMYNWTCITGSGNCTNANLEKNIHECTQALEVDVVPHLDRISNVQVAEILCKHVREYQICILQGSKSLCPTVSAPDVTNLNELTSGMYTKYEWLCTFSPKACNTSAFESVLSQCAKIITDVVIPNVEMTKDAEKLKEACSGHKKFRACIVELGPGVCPHTNFRDEDTAQNLTRGLFNQYSWTCAEQGRICTKRESKAAVDGCSDIISTKILQNINLHDRRQLRNSCEGVREYVRCVSSALSAKCPTDLRLGRISLSNITSEVQTRYSWTCSVKTMNCTPENAENVVATCSHILEDTVIPATHVSVFDMKLPVACSEFRRYQDCIVTEGKKICPHDDMEDANVLVDITGGNFNKYNWTCTTDLSNCSVANFNDILNKCQKLLVQKVIPNIRLPTSKEVMDIACVYVTKYQDCMARKAFEICPVEKAITREWLQNATAGSYSKHFWVCEPQKVSCTVEKLSEVIESCEDQIQSYVIPYASNYTNKKALKFACQGNKKYQDCVIYHGNTLCPTVVFDIDLLNKMTKNMFTKYNWTCHENGTGCSFQLMSSVLEKCSSIISSEVIPLVDESSQEMLSAACKGVRRYQECAIKAVRSVCFQESLLAEVNLDNVTEGLYSEYNWTCEGLKPVVEVSPKCDARFLYQRAKECLGFIKVKVQPFTKDNTLVAFLKTACKNNNLFKQCINSKIPASCLKYDKLMESDGLKQLINVYEDYRWTCKLGITSGSACNAKIGKSLVECAGIIDVLVAKDVSVFHSSVEVAETCRHLKSYETCMMHSIKGLCEDGIVFAQNSEVLKYMIEYYNKYSWACVSTPENSCTTEILTEKLKECRGFIDFIVKPNAALSFSMQDSCLGLQDYRTCVYTGIMESCATNATRIANSTAVDQYLYQVMDKHASVCRPDTQPVPECNEKVVTEKLRRCKGIITWLVLPNMEKPDDDEQQQLACFAVADYQACVTKSTRQLCPNTNIYSDDTMDDLTGGLYTKYSSTCRHRKKSTTTLAPPVQATTVHIRKTPHCSEKSATKALMECMGFMHVKVMPNAGARHDPEKLKVACRSMKHYQQCVNEKIRMCANHSEVTESLLIKYYTDELYRKYEWTCEPATPKAVCNPFLVLGPLENCSKQLNAAVHELYPEEVTTWKADAACTAVSIYQDCVNSKVNLKCGLKVLPQTPHVLHYVRDLYNKYNWTCKTGQADNCDGNEVMDSLTECLGFLNVLVLPYIANSSKNASLETACTGYQEFKYCISSAINAKCPRSPYVLRLPRVQYFTHDLVQNYKWTCDAVHQKKRQACRSDELVAQLEKCYSDHVKTKVIPNADPGSGLEKLQRACSALNTYQECVNEEITGSCAGNQGQVLLLDAVKNYTYSVYEEYQWTCDNHPDCNKNSLLNELTSCKGIMTTKVIPNAVNISDVSKLSEACRGTRLYQDCVRQKMTAKCSAESPLFLLPEVAHFSFATYNKYNWTCFRKREGRASETTNKIGIVKQLKECYGFILFGVKRPLRNNFKDKAMREACLSVKDYQKCVRAKLDHFSSQHVSLPDSQDVKYYSARLYSKYNWTCDSLSVGLKSHQCNVDTLESGLKQCKGLADYAVAQEKNKTDLNSVCEYYLDHQTCVESQLQECRFFPSVLKLSRIRRHTGLLNDSYKSYCSFLMPDKPNCSSGRLSELYQQCLGFISYGVVPNLGSDTTELDLPAVQRYLDNYKGCIQEVTKLACGSAEMSQEVQMSLANPVQIVKKYSHFISTNNCSESSLSSALRECDGIWDLDVEPLLKYTDNSDLIQACSSIEIFGNCVKQKVIPLCEKMEVASSHQSVHSYLSNALDVYKTICSRDLNAVNEAMCSKTELVAAFSECGGVIDYRVIPFADDPYDKVKLGIACSGVREYKRCIFSRLTPVCEDKVVPMSNEVTKYLRNYYNLYDWTCNTTESQSHCDKEELKKNLAKCVGLLNKEFDVSVMGLNTEYLCTFLEDYKLCLSMRTSPECRRDDAVMRSPDIIYYTTEIISKFMGLCNMIDVKECNKNTILESVHKCKGLVDYALIDSIQDSGDIDAMKQACGGLFNYRHCVHSEIFKVCDASSPILQDKTVQQYAVDVPRNLSWVCDLNTKPEDCTVKNILPSISECQGFIEGIGDPHNLRKSDSFALNIACSFVQQYRECIDLNIRSVCKEPKVLSEISEISFYTQDLYHKYLWTCERKKSRTLCNVDDLTVHLKQCEVFLIPGVVPYVDNTFETLKYSYVCESFTAYSKCIQKMKSTICGSKDITASPEIKMLLYNKVNEYKWYCSSKKIGNGDCNEEHLEDELKHCLGFVKTVVRPKVLGAYNASDMKMACSALEDYKYCVVSKISKHCGYDTTVVQKPSIRKYLFDLYDKHKWICQEHIVTDCTARHVMAHAKSCELHLNFTSSPLAARDPDSSTVVCRGLHQYHSCFKRSYLALCGRAKTVHLWNTITSMVSKRAKLTHEACLKHKDPINIDSCNTKVLAERSRRCQGIVDTNLIPNIRKKNNSPKINEACSAYKQFQHCLRQNLGHCNISIAPNKDILENYKWVCTETFNHSATATCNETELLSEMQGCLGIMYFIVIPNAGQKSKPAIAKACEGLKHYQNCVLSKTSRVCATKVLVRSTKVRRLTRHIMKKFSWTCSLSGQDQNCKTHSIVDHLKTCLGFIDLAVAPNIFYPEDKAKMQMACSGLEDYQDCVDSKIYEMCPPLNKYLKRKDVKLFTEFLPSKYSWVCHTSYSHQCTLRNLMENLKICRGLVTSVLFAKLDSGKLVGDNRPMACSALQSFELCVTVQMGRICSPDDLVLHHHDVRAATTEILDAYGWVCNDTSSVDSTFVDTALVFRKSGCEDDLLRDRLTHCRELFNRTAPVELATDKFHAGDIELTCKAVKSYEQCARAAQLELCSKAGENAIISEYSRDLYKEYNWTCNLASDALCDESFLLKSIPACLAVLKNEVIEHVGSISNAKAQKMACEGYKRYQSCVKYIVDSSCQNIDIDNTASHVGIMAFLTRRLASSFQWACNGFHCSSPAVTTSIRECVRSLEELSNSFIRNNRVNPCEKVTAYRECILKKMDLPCRLNHHLLESKELEHYTDVLYNAFDGFCSGVQSECNKEEMLQSLYKCEEIILKQVQPHTTDRGNAYESRLACRGLHEYKWCVSNVKTMFHCKSDDEFDSEGDVDKLVLAIEDKYNWTCEQDAKTCNAPKFKSHLKSCFSILATDVLPHILDHDNASGMDLACRGVHQYQVCVSKKLYSLCKQDKPVYSNEMLYFRDKVTSLLSWTCSWTSPRGRCDVHGMLQKMALCASELEQAGIPTGPANNSISEKMEGCRAFTTYKTCLSGTIPETCNKETSLMESKAVHHFTVDIPNQYARYCDYKDGNVEIARQMSRCDEESLRMRYIECSQIISSEVIPYTDEPSDSPLLNDACKAMRKYQNCIAKIPTQDCSNGLKIPFSEESRYYVSVLKKKYEWVCNGNGDYMCNPEILLLYLSKCEATFMKSHVNDYVDVDVLGVTDCREVQNYQWCLRNSIFESDCEYYQNILTSPEVLYFTDKLLRPYTKSCHVNLDCQIGTLYSQLSECTPIIKVKVLPFVQRGWVQNPITACGGTREYQRCFRQAMQKTTCDKNTALFKLAEVQYYRSFLFNAYNWTCFEHAAPVGSCEKNLVLRDLQKCEGSIFQNTTSKKPISCSSLSMANFLNCVDKTNMKLACNADPEKVSGIAKQAREILLDYRATCGFDHPATFLGNKFLLNEFERCQLMLKKSDRLLKAAQIRETKVLDACRSLQLFSLCTESAVILGKNVDSPHAAEVRNASEVMASSYELKCAPNECNRNQVVDDLLRCFHSSAVFSNCSATLKANATTLAEPCMTEVFRGHACARKVDVVYVAREVLLAKVEAHRRDCNMLRSQYRHCSHKEFSNFLQKCYETFLREVTGKSIATPKFCRTYHKYASCVDEASAETSCFNATTMQAPYEVSLRNFTSKYAEVCTQYIRSTEHNDSSSVGHRKDIRAKHASSDGQAFTSSKSSWTVVVFCLAMIMTPFLLSPFTFRNFT
ncbi:uncharacterized protein LOC142563836 isoform X2 [Dermacentor variabilis]|uniref:uncharacterized protein LOC142563836 isoform X2 n=1 Tax=Dermacentor variabilis TaxID=34621 RepID=UPI003F5B3714